MKLGFFLLPFLRFTQQLKGEPVPQELLDRLCELIAVLAGGAAAKYEALKVQKLCYKPTTKL